MCLFICRTCDNHTNVPMSEQVENLQGFKRTDQNYIQNLCIRHSSSTISCICLLSTQSGIICVYKNSAHMYHTHLQTYHSFVSEYMYEYCIDGE